MMWTWELERVLHAWLQALPGLGVVGLAAVIGVAVLVRRPLAGVSLLCGLAVYAFFEVFGPIQSLGLDLLVYDVAGLTWTYPLAMGIYAFHATIRALAYAAAVVLMTASVFLARRRGRAGEAG